MGVVLLLLVVALPALVLTGPVTAVAVTRPLWRPGFRSPERTRHLALLVILLTLGGALVLAALELLGWSVAMAIAYRDHSVPAAEQTRGLLGAGAPPLCVAGLLLGAFAARCYRVLHVLAVLAPVLVVGPWVLVSSAAR